MTQKRNLAALNGLGRRPSRALRNDPGAGRATAGLGASDVSLGEQFTVDSNQRLSLKKAASVPLASTTEASDLQATLNSLITNLRASGIIEG